MSDLVVRKGDLAALSDMDWAVAISKTGLIPPHYRDKPANILMARAKAKELGMPPLAFLSNSFPVNDKITIMTEFMGGIVKKHPQYGGVVILEHTDVSFKAIVKRLFPTFTEEFETSFTKADAEIAGLWGKTDVWRKYPKIMLKHRALAYGWRTVFPDLLAGIYTVDELDKQGNVMRNVSPEPEAGEYVEEGEDAFAQLSDPLWDALLVKIKKARLGDKEENDLRKRYDNTKGSDRARKSLLVSLNAELDSMLEGQDE